MGRTNVLRTVAFGVAFLLTGVALLGQDNARVVLRGVEVEVSEGERLVLHAPDGRSYELAGLRARRECEGAAGVWACGEASRQLLQSAVAGEKLDCAILLEEGDRSGVECMAQTRNLNLWMLRGAGVDLLSEWWGREGVERFRDAELAGRATRELARALAESDPLNIRSRSSEGIRRRAAREAADDPPWPSVPLGERVQRRGATVEERRIIAEGAVEDSLRAGVWELGGSRVILGEDLQSCLYDWCRFAVVDSSGEVVLSGTARGAPRVVVADGPAFVVGSLEPLVLTWEEPGGAWERWSTR